MKTSVVLLNYNGEKLLSQFLPNVLTHTSIPDVEIVVIDNGSTDQSVELLNKKFPTVRCIALDQNYGFAGGYNRGLAQIEADLFVLLNTDVEVTNHWLIPLLDMMEKDDRIAACQPKILSYAQRITFEHAGACGGFIDQYGYPFCRGRLFTTLEHDLGQHDSIMEIFWASGACLMIRSEIFREHGGFDDRFFAHMEEIDLCWRLKNRGFKIVCVPQSVVYHIGGASLDPKNVRKTYLNFRNNWLMLYKNMTDRELRKVYFLRFFLDYMAAFQMIVTFQRGHAYHVWKARHDFKRMRGLYQRERTENMQKRTVQKPSGILRRSLVIAYYVLGKKYFNEIENEIDH
ncbi:MAG: glycosyltransferase family 2 protein [Microbacter sp.]